MSRSLKTVGAFTAILLAALAARNLPGTADEPADSPDVKGRSKSDAQPDNAPRPRSRPRGADAPLGHAILKKDQESAEDRILKALDKPTNVEWQELALEDCIAYLSDFHGISFWLDKTSITEEGVALDQPITLKLMGVRLDSVLNLLLQPVQLEWLIQDEVLKVTTRAWCEDHPEVRAHEIQGLIDAGHSPEELIASITACIEPASWSPKDGFAGISHTGGVLVVRQTQRLHAEISRLLVELDDIADSEAEAHHGHDKAAVVSVKVYPTGDQPAEKVAEALQDFVESRSWKKRGGGEGEVRALDGTMVVKQTAQVHRAIQRFLAQLEPRIPSAAAATASQPATAPGAPAVSPDPFRVLKPAPKVDTGNPLRKKVRHQIRF